MTLTMENKTKENEENRERKRITIVFGPCAIESEEQIKNTAEKASIGKEIVYPFGIDIGVRGGAWKPRTSSYNLNGDGTKEMCFEGTTFRGLIWLANAGQRFKLPVVSELMSERDIRFFDGSYNDEDLKKADFGSMKEDFSDLMGPENHFNGLDPMRDYIQIGARTSKAYALLHRVGNTKFGVLLKNPEHGVIIKDAEGSLQRLEHNREVIYCTRGQIRYIHPTGIEMPEHKAYLDQLMSEPDQHPDSRNYNNIAAINILRSSLSQNYPHVKFYHDPSHTQGGKTHQMRRNIGEYAIKAITEYGYDGVMVEVNDRSKDAKCDKEQALLTTRNGVDWSQTYVGKPPPENLMPLTLVDIVYEIMKYQVSKGFGNERDLEYGRKELEKIKWG